MVEGIGNFVPTVRLLRRIMTVSKGQSVWRLAVGQVGNGLVVTNVMTVNIYLRDNL